jgi:hypothetical protein
LITAGRIHWLPEDRIVPHDAILHETVYPRLAFPSVRNFDHFEKYRRRPLAAHDKARK